MANFLFEQYVASLQAKKNQPLQAWRDIAQAVSIGMERMRQEDERKAKKKQELEQLGLDALKQAFKQEQAQKELGLKEREVASTEEYRRKATEQQRERDIAESQLGYIGKGFLPYQEPSKPPLESLLIRGQPGTTAGTNIPPREEVPSYVTDIYGQKFTYPKPEELSELERARIENRKKSLELQEKRLGLESQKIQHNRNILENAKSRYETDRQGAIQSANAILKNNQAMLSNWTLELTDPERTELINQVKEAQKIIAGGISPISGEVKDKFGFIVGEVRQGYKYIGNNQWQKQ